MTCIVLLTEPIEYMDCDNYAARPISRAWRHATTWGESDISVRDAVKQTAPNDGRSIQVHFFAFLFGGLGEPAWLLSPPGGGGDVA